MGIKRVQHSFEAPRLLFKTLSNVDKNMKIYQMYTTKVLYNRTVVRKLKILQWWSNVKIDVHVHDVTN